MARHYYQSNSRRMRLIDEFERTYRSKEALDWCFRAPFPSNLLRRGFMFYDYDQLCLCRFLLVDASRNIGERAIRTGNSEWYRGMKLPIGTVVQFEKHIGQLVAACGFMFCMKSRAAALEQAKSSGYRPDLTPVLFKIESDPTVQVATVSTVDQPSIFVFDIGTTFRVLCLNHGPVTIVKMRAVLGEGKRLVQQFREQHQETPTATLLADLVRVDNGLVNESGSTEYNTEAEELVKAGRIDSAIGVYRRAHPTSAAILRRLGQLYAEKKGDYDNALNCYTEVLKLQEQVNDPSRKKVSNEFSNRSPF